MKRAAVRVHIVSVHRFRRVARVRERVLQRRLNTGWRPDDQPWARGARVQSAGRKQHAVVLTEHRGR